MSRAQHPAVLAAIALAFAAAGCSGDRPATPLRIGMNPWPGYAHLAVAQEQGFFAAHGIDARIVEFTSLHDLRRGFAEGQIDVLPSTLVEVMALTRDRGRQPLVAWVADASQGSDVVVANTALVADGFRGKTIAYEPATLGCYMLTRFLDQLGLSRDAVRAVGMDQARMASALADGRIAAAITYPPFDARMLAQPGRSVVFTSAAIPGEIVDTLTIDQGLVDADTTLVARFQSALADTHAFCRREPATARDIIARVTGMDGEELTAAMAGVIAYGPEAQHDWLVDGTRLQQLATATARALGEVPPALRLPRREHFAAELRPAAPR